MKLLRICLAVLACAVVPAVAQQPEHGSSWGVDLQLGGPGS